MRTSVSEEISNSTESVKRAGKLLKDLDKATTFETSFFPWLPTPFHFKKMKSVAQLFYMFKNDAQARISSTQKVEDPMQALVDRGDTADIISQVSFSELKFWSVVTHSEMRICSIFSLHYLRAFVSINSFS